MVDLKAFPKDRLDDLLTDLEKAGSLAELDDEWTPVLAKVPAAHLRRLSTANSAWKEREKVYGKLAKSLEVSGLPPLPRRASDKALVPHKLWALGRAARMCPKRTFEDEEAWSDALAAHIDTWSGAVNLSLKRGELACRLKNDHPAASQFQDYARRRENLSDLASHRWMATRRGEKAGALELSLTWPRSNIQSFVNSMLPRMGPEAMDRGGEAVADELILNDLSNTLRNILDRRAEDEAIRSAVTLFTDLLKGPPLCDAPVGSVSVGPEGKGLGVAVITNNGTLALGEVIDGEDWQERMLTTLRGQGLECAVLPSTAPDKERLAEVRKVLSPHFAVIPVRSAALSEARKQTLEKQSSLTPELASALVLAGRALDPATAWSQVDPVNIGLAEYQNDIDPKRLKSALLEARKLFVLDRVGNPSHVPMRPVRAGKARSSATPRASQLKPNPLVKSIEDLKPGMTVVGIVSNITRFGVFVNLGLDEEAMIHISELSDDFISSPEDAVSLGQQVNATVLEVEVEKKRVALSMKTQASKPDRGAKPSRKAKRVSPRPMGGGRGDRRERRDRRGGRGGGGRARNEALRQLEDLFKK